MSNASDGMTRAEALIKREGDEVRILSLWPRGAGGSCAIKDPAKIISIKHERSQTSVQFEVEHKRGGTSSGENPSRMPGDH